MKIPCIFLAGVGCACLSTSVFAADIFFTGFQDPDDWISSAFSRGMSDGGGWVGVDVFAYDPASSTGSIGTDGVDDILVRYDSYTNSGTTMNSVYGGASAFRHVASMAGAGDHSAINYQFRFVNGFRLSTGSINEFDMSSMNGSSSRYEYGLSQLMGLNYDAYGNAGDLVTWTDLSSFDAANYPGAGGANTLIHDLIGDREGIAFYTGATTLDPTLDPLVSGTGVSNANQHWSTDVVGGDLWNYFGTDPGDDPVMGFSLWGGQVVVGTSVTSSGTASGSIGGLSFENAYIPEPSAVIYLLVGVGFLWGRRRRA